MSTALAEKDARAGSRRDAQVRRGHRGRRASFAAYAFVQNTLALDGALRARALMERYFETGFYRSSGRAFGSTPILKRAPSALSSAPPNPEHSLCEDTRRFAETCASLLTTVAQKLLSLCAFTRVLYSISPRSFLPVFCTTRARRCSDRLPVYLTDADAACAESEAHLRSLLLRVRDHAESIAFCRGGAREFRNAIASLRRVAPDARAADLSPRDRRLSPTLSSSRRAAPSLVIAPRYYRGDVAAIGAVTQAGYVQNRERRVERRRRKVRGTHRARRRDGAARGARGGFFPRRRLSTAYSRDKSETGGREGYPKNPTSDDDKNDTSDDVDAPRVANVSAAVPADATTVPRGNVFSSDGDALP